VTLTSLIWESSGGQLAVFSRMGPAGWGLSAAGAGVVRDIDIEDSDRDQTR